MTQGNATTFINGLTSDTKLLRSDDSVLRFRVLNESIQIKAGKGFTKERKKIQVVCLVCGSIYHTLFNTYTDISVRLTL